MIKGLGFSAPTPKAQCLLWHCIVSLSFISCHSEPQHSMEFRISLSQPNFLLFKQNTLQLSDVTFPLLFTVQGDALKIFISFNMCLSYLILLPACSHLLVFCFYFFFIHIYFRLHHIYFSQSDLLHLVKDRLDLLTLPQIAKL